MQPALQGRQWLPQSEPQQRLHIVRSSVPLKAEQLYTSHPGEAVGILHPLMSTDRASTGLATLPHELCPSCHHVLHEYENVACIAFATAWKLYKPTRTHQNGVGILMLAESIDAEKCDRYELGLPASKSSNFA